MRILIVVATVCSVGGLLAGAAHSEPLQGTHNRQQLSEACGKAGGSYWSNLDRYGCNKENCDGKGGMCSVTCENNGKCDGYTPPATIVGGQPLKNLSQVLGVIARSPASGGSKGGKLAPGLLEGGGGLTPTGGPAAAGTPARAPAAPSGGGLR